MIAITDYNIGNITAVANMLQRLDVRCKITSKVDDIEQADKIILPGNGSFDACMNNLHSSGLVPALEKKVINGDMWSHIKIILQPESTINSYEPIELDNETFAELRVIGELVAVLS